MHSTHLRKEHLHGLMVGIAVGDALGLPRRNLSSRHALRCCGRPAPLLTLLPNRGWYSTPTQQVLLAAQSLLRSRNSLRTFRGQFQSRLRWLALSCPAAMDSDTRTVAMRSCWKRAGTAASVDSQNAGAATRAMFCALAINGAGHDFTKWIESSTQLTHAHSTAIDGCLVLAALSEYAARHPGTRFDRLQALAGAQAMATTEELKVHLSQLVELLAANKSPRMVARHFGWKDRIDDHIIPIAVMSIYCWLRHPDDIQRATLAAVSLGGQTHLLGAIVGGLVGAHVGISRLPEELTSKLNGFPHGPSWIEKMAHRLSRWPHGEHDLHTAPALASRPVFQLLRNLSLRCILLGHRLKNRCAVAQTSDSSGTSSSANSSEQTQCLGMN